MAVIGVAGQCPCIRPSWHARRTGRPCSASVLWQPRPSPRTRKAHGVRGEHHVLGLHRRVDNHPPCVLRLHRLAHVEDLVEPRAEQILFSRLPPLAWSRHCCSLDAPPPRRLNHALQSKGISLKHRLPCNAKPANPENYQIMSIGCR